MNFPKTKRSTIKTIGPHQPMILLSQKAVLLIAILLAGVLFACSSSSETIIKDKKISVAVPSVSQKITDVESFNVNEDLQTLIDINATDSSFYQFSEITKEGVEIKAKVFLKDKQTQKPKLELEVKQPDVEFSYTDTTKHTTIKEANSPVDYLIYLIILAVVVAAVIIFLKFRK